MHLCIHDRFFFRAFARRVLGRPSRVMAHSLIELHDRSDGLELHIRMPHRDLICIAWIAEHAYLLPGTSAAWLTVDDLFGIEPVLNELIADMLHRHRITDPCSTKRGIA